MAAPTPFPLSQRLPLPFLPPPPPVCHIRPPSPTALRPHSPPTWLTSLFQVLIPPSLARSLSRPNPVSDFLEHITDTTDNAPPSSPVRYASPPRLVALGDVHGDLEAMRSALLFAGLIDSKDNWIGGRAHLVQVGDQMDRGSRERDIYKLLFHLQDTAPKHGGRVHILLGNHELMNSRLDFRYVTKGGFADFASATHGAQQRARAKDAKAREIPWWNGGFGAVSTIPGDLMREIRELPAEMRARAKSVCRGGPLARELGDRAKVSVVVGDNLFVHGGLTPTHLTFGGRGKDQAVEVLDELNRDTSLFLKGKGKLPMVLKGGGSPVWLRDYSRVSLGNGGAKSSACGMLRETLKMVGAKRMVVGHTPQPTGINSACGGKVWRIDTGMSKVYGGRPEAIEITKRGAVRIFTKDGVVQGSARYR
eukprot:GFKZ01013950.1.p1 GENE.GFKZ01013950.1~~GFKZ01013950.1.p1  ORF type:complete len:454 (-),score=66.06 GFKZ01013950.1:2303-3565(-)